jgi:hypothetical protein
MRRSSASKVRYKARRKPARDANRRGDRRLKLDRLVRVPVQIFPVLPFLGAAVDGAILNLSAGGMALMVDVPSGETKLSTGRSLRIHFRLPGMPLTECRAIITHADKENGNGWLRLGIRFEKAAAALARRIQVMAKDDEACDTRITQTARPRCELSCSFHSLCGKPIRQADESAHAVQFEIALQKSDH